VQEGRVAQADGWALRIAGVSAPQWSGEGLQRVSYCRFTDLGTRPPRGPDAGADRGGCPALHQRPAPLHPRHPLIASSTPGTVGYTSGTVASTTTWRTPAGSLATWRGSGMGGGSGSAGRRDAGGETSMWRYGGYGTSPPSARGLRPLMAQPRVRLRRCRVSRCIVDPPSSRKLPSSPEGPTWSANAAQEAGRTICLRVRSPRQSMPTTAVVLPSMTVQDRPVRPQPCGGKARGGQGELWRQARRLCAAEFRDRLCAAVRDGWCARGGGCPSKRDDPPFSLPTRSTFTPPP
jgi:hypothetical protein